MDTNIYFNRRHSFSQSCVCANNCRQIYTCRRIATHTLLGRQTVLSSIPRIPQSFPLSLDHPVTRLLCYGVPQSPQFITSPFFTMEIPPLSTGQAGRALQLLTENHSARLDQLAGFAHYSHATESESEDETYDFPRMDTSHDFGAAAAVLQITNFSLHEINAIWGILKDDIVSTWNTGRERRCGVTPKDAFCDAHNS